MNFTNPMDYWRLCDRLSAVQAALLIIGEDPSENEQYILGWQIHEQPEGFNPAFSAIRNAITSKKLPAKIIHSGENITFEVDDGWQSEWVKDDIPDWHKTTLEVEDLKKWLSSRGFTSGFFFPLSSDDRPYLDKNNPYYASKLAAAVRAWESVTSNLSDYKTKTPKQALDIWLRKNANEFGLLNEEGNPINQSIEEISKISNWKTSGGATKTPSNENPPTPETTGNDIDTEIPF